MKKKLPEEEIMQAIELMNAVLNDSSVPRNIRAVVEEAKNKIEKKENLSVETSAAIYLLDDISNDINMPSHTRTEIWAIISKLEAIKEKIK